ncbi:hypothetical protein [Haloferula sp. A504]|uniref:hypothetical protein n=1 Tax=Haloferula sp. A504 TaxID=3373601 RepID=UPI0031BD0885|nr:hypothetical protein [Verrucomicrobiaceae bacterium E54]
MGTLQEIEEAIDRLPKDQVFALGEWLQRRIDAQWDQQLEDDVEAGRLNKVAEEALSEYRAGKSKSFPSDAE